MNRIIIKKWQYLLMIIIWMLFIFYLSDQVAVESQAASDGIVEIVLRFINSLLDKIHFPIIIDTQIVTFIVRKAAHFILYFMLGFIIYWAMDPIDPMDFSFNLMLIALCICIGYALFDEFHQLFVIGRSGELRDICVNALGSVFGVLIAKLAKKKVLC